jgi:hypothetical protein
MQSGHYISKMFLNLYLGIFLGILHTACGPKGSKQVDLRNSNPRSAALMQQISSQLELSGSLVDLDAKSPTNLRNLSLVTKFKISPLDSLTEDSIRLRDLFLPVKVQVFDSTGVSLWEKTENFREIMWDVPLLKGGELTVNVEPVGIIPGVTSAKSWQKKILADFDGPKITLVPTLDAADDLGNRSLKITVTVIDEKTALCPTAEVQHLGGTSSQTITLNSVTPPGQDPGSPLIFVGSAILKAEALKGTPLVIVTCRDGSGNVGEVREPTQMSTTNYSLAIDTVGSKGPYESEGSTVQVTYLQNTELGVNLKLLNADSGTVIPDNLADIYKNNLVVYFTDKAPSNLADLSENKGSLWTQNFEKSITIKLPPLLNGFQNIYATLVFKDQVLGKDFLATSIKLPLFITKIVPKVSILTNPKITKPDLKTPLELVATIQAEGAPLKPDGIYVELTIDGQTWTKVPATLKDEQNKKILTFDYPFATEMPLRARVKIVDLAGYESFSNTSAFLVGLDPNLLAVDAKERDQCKAQGQDGSHLRPWLVSKYLCRKSNGSGGLSATPYAVLLMQNRGIVAPQFYETTFQKKGLGYKVYVDGVEASANRIEPPSDFVLDPKNQRLFHLALNPDWLKASLVEIRMDLEATDVNSTTNNCYPNQKPFTAVTILDKTAGLIPTLDAYECSADQGIGVSP